MNTGKNISNKGDFKKKCDCLQTYVSYMISAITVMKCYSHHASLYFICYNKLLMTMRGLILC